MNRMTRMAYMTRTTSLALLAAVAAPAGAQPASGGITIRVAAFNLSDVRTADLADPANLRLRELAEVIQRVRPNVILLNEIAYDLPGAPDVAPAGAPGRNGQRFADAFLAVAQASDVAPLRLRAFMALTNSGAASGMDLDHDGRVVSNFPLPPAPPGAEPSEAARRFGGDCWGFGAFPGQNGMALLVDDRLEILVDHVRTFRLLPWDYVPGAYTPVAADGKTPWFTADEQGAVRLSSTSHWDIPVRLPGGAVVHFLCSNPAPPAPDGPERRSARRNHDEVRFWADYLDGDSYIVDDKNNPGGLEDGAAFVILGGLNAEPDEGDSFKNPIGTVLFPCARIDSGLVPRADRAIAGLDPADTASSGLRVDYVLPSRGLGPRAAGIWRDPPILAPGGKFASGHFPVWMDLTVPPPPRPDR